MPKADIDYVFPETVAEAVRLKQQAGAGGRFIAGGTDLMLMIEQQMVDPRALIDLTHIPELHHLEMVDDRVHIGSAVTYRQLLDHPEFCAALPFLAKAIRTIGGVQIRNVATLAGNIANASPAGDTLPCLYVLGATVHVAGPDGITADIPIEEFILGVRQVALRPAQLITHISFPLPGSCWVGAFGKLGLRHAMAIAVASVAVLLQWNGQLVVNARIALGSVAPTVIRAPEAEAALAGRPLHEEQIEEAARQAMAAAHPIDDVRASARYRQLVSGGLVRKALRACRAD